MLVAGSLFGCAAFSYLYLWTVSPRIWPAEVPHWGYGVLAAVLVAASSACVGLANRALKRARSVAWPLSAAIALLVGGVAVEFAAQRELSPSASAYGAAVYLIASLAAFYASVVIAMTLFVLARNARGMVNAVRRVTFDNARLFWHYAVAQTLAGLLLVHGFPRLVA